MDLIFLKVFQTRTSTIDELFNKVFVQTFLSIMSSHQKQIYRLGRTSIEYLVEVGRGDHLLPKEHLREKKDYFDFFLSFKLTF